MLLPLILAFAAAGDDIPLLGSLNLTAHAPAFAAAGVTSANVHLLQSHDLAELGLSLPQRLAWHAAVANGSGTASIAGAIATGGDGRGLDMATAHQDFMFTIANYKTQRQMGKLLNVAIKYRYPDNVSSSHYIEYVSAMRSVAMAYLEPTKALPVKTYWELVNMAIVSNLTLSFPSVVGFSSQILVQGDVNGSMYEPGDHGSLVTVGNIEPLNILPSFWNTPV